MQVAAGMLAKTGLGLESKVAKGPDRKCIKKSWMKKVFLAGKPTVARTV